MRMRADAEYRETMKALLCGCFVLLLSTLSIAVRADTKGEIAGKMKDGSQLVVFGCDDPGGCFIAVYRHRRSMRRIEHAHEPCVAAGLDIACAANGKSPLAGTHYIGKPMKWTCGRPKTLYRLVKAPRKSLAPRLLVENQDCEP